jgi:hypothetical protein
MEESSPTPLLLNPSIHQFEDLFNQLEVLKETLNNFLNFNNELIDKNSLESR